MRRIGVTCSLDAFGFDVCAQSDDGLNGALTRVILEQAGETMMKKLSATGVACLAIGCMSLSACSPGTKATRIAQTQTGMHEIAGLYEKATGHHRRAFRKSVRDARARAMRILATKATQLVAETVEWDSDARLTSVEAAGRDEVRTTVATFRNSLRNLSDAAAKSRPSDVREHYAAALASYRRLTAITESAN